MKTSSQLFVGKRAAKKDRSVSGLLATLLAAGAGLAAVLVFGCLILPYEIDPAHGVACFAGLGGFCVFSARWPSAFPGMLAATVMASSMRGPAMVSLPAGSAPPRALFFRLCLNRSIVPEVNA